MRQVSFLVGQQTKNVLETSVVFFIQRKKGMEKYIFRINEFNFVKDEDGMYSWI